MRGAWLVLNDSVHSADSQSTQIGASGTHAKLYVIDDARNVIDYSNDEKIKFRMREQGLQHITDSIDDNIRLEHAYRCGFDVLKKLVGEESSMELTTGQVLCCADMCLCLDGVYNSSFRKSAIGGGGCRHVFACRIQDQIDAGEMTIADLEENLSLFLINRFDADAAILSDGDCNNVGTAFGQMDMDYGLWIESVL